jgi:hypothetical protein
MDEMIAERKEEYERDPESVSKRSDLLANLITAAANDQGSEVNGLGNGELKKRSLSLNASELRGWVASYSGIQRDDVGDRNVFIYLIAGHEVPTETVYH